MDPSTKRIRVLVADDHPVFRRGMRAILGAEPDTELVGEAEDGEETIARALELRPDVILMDLNMPKVSGIEATRRILDAQPDTTILVLTMLETTIRSSPPCVPGPTGTSSRAPTGPRCYGRSTPWPTGRRSLALRSRGA
jgi:response regulator RpfG family c-di-GMP phosphodiesterase